MTFDFRAIKFYRKILNHFEFLNMNKLSKCKKKKSEKCIYSNLYSVMFSSLVDYAKYSVVL